MHIANIRNLQDAECLKDMLRRGYAELEKYFHDGAGFIDKDEPDGVLAYAKSMLRLNELFTDIMTNLNLRIDELKEKEND